MRKSTLIRTSTTTSTTSRYFLYGVPSPFPPQKLLLAYASIILLLVVVGFMAFRFESSITGLAIYQDSTGIQNWTFSSGNGYSYDSSLVDLSSGQALLKSTTTTSTVTTVSKNSIILEKAYTKAKDETDKVNVDDSKKLTKDNDVLLDVIGTQAFQSGDTVTLVLNGGDSGTVYLCPAGTICSSSNYGSAAYSGTGTSSTGTSSVSAVDTVSVVESVSVIEDDGKEEDGEVVVANIQVNPEELAAEEVSTLPNVAEEVVVGEDITSEQEEQQADSAPSAEQQNVETENIKTENIEAENEKDKDKNNEKNTPGTGAAVRLFSHFFANPWQAFETFLKDFLSTTGGAVEVLESDTTLSLTLQNIPGGTTAFSIAGTKLKIDQIVLSRGNLLFALYKPQEKTSEWSSKDGSTASLKDENLLRFSQSLNDGDVVSLYITAGTGTIQACAYGTSCSSSYGTVSVNGAGWYNITLSGVASSTISLFSSSNLDVDLVEVQRITASSSPVASTAYSAQGAIETVDFSPSGWYSWGTFTARHQLNGQSITYGYSTNQGTSWSDISSGADLSSISSGTIRFRAVLSSNQTATPSVESFSLSYTIRQCQENWQVQASDCFLNDTKIISYHDQNDCGTSLQLPADNGTAASCNFCSFSLANTSWTSWQNQTTCQVNNTLIQNRSRTQYDRNYSTCSALTQLPSDLWNSGNNLTFWEVQQLSCQSCIPVWEMVNGSCRVDDTFFSWYNDTQKCAGALPLALPTVSPCDYCLVHNCSEATEKTLNFTKDIPFIFNTSDSANASNSVNAPNRGNAHLEIITKRDVHGANISLIEYEYSLVNSTPLEKVALPHFLNITSTMSKEDISEVTIVLYYTPEEIAQQSLIEETLAIHYYNDSSGSWEKLESIVDNSSNAVSATISHFSLYGLYGDSAPTVSPSSGSSSGGGSGGGSGGSGGGSKGGSSDSGRIGTGAAESRTTIPTETVSLPVFSLGQENSKSFTETAVQGFCDYSLELWLPDTLSFMNTNTQQGIITNKGTCPLEDVSFGLDQPLASSLTIRTDGGSLGVGEQRTVTLSNIPSQGLVSSVVASALPSALSGAAIVDTLISKPLSGNIHIQARGQDGSLFEDSLPVSIHVPSPGKLITGSLVLILLPLAAVVLIFTRRKRKKHSLRKS